jgi:hypothetical protein
MTSMMMGIADFPVATLKALAIHPDSDEKKAKKAAAKKAKLEGSTPTESSASSTSLRDTETASSPSVSRASTMALSSTPSRISIDRSSPPESPGVEKLKELETDNLSRESTKTVDSTSSTLRTTSLEETSRVTSPRSSLAEALRSLPENSRPRSPSRNRSPSGFGRSNSTSRKPKTEHTHSWSESSGHPNPIDTAYGTGKGITKIVGAGVKSPMDLLLGISKGFHNLPKLYGEEVRQTGRVTGIKSGLQTAGKVG